MPHLAQVQPPLRNDKIVNQEGRPILRFVEYLEAMDPRAILQDAQILAEDAAQGAYDRMRVLLGTQAARITAGAQNIVVVTGDYTQQITDDILLVTGSYTITMLPVADAVKSVLIKSDGDGTVTLTPDGTETMELLELTTSQASRFVPGGSTFSWVAV